MDPSTQHAADLRSSFSSDPDMKELIELFVSEMPDRVATMRAALSQESWEQLKRIGHQLKGAGAGYGFQAITVEAGTLEAHIKELAPGSPQDQLERIRGQALALIRLCERVRV